MSRNPDHAASPDGRCVRDYYAGIRDHAAGHGRRCTQDLGTTAGGTGAWSATGLPGGFSIGTGTPGICGGVAGRICGTASNTFNGSFTATRGTVSKVVALRIVAATPQLFQITSSPGTVASFSIGSFSGSQLAVSGGTFPYVWSLESGSLPTGILLQPTARPSAEPLCRFVDVAALHADVAIFNWRPIARRRRCRRGPSRGLLPTAQLVPSLPPSAQQRSSTSPLLRQQAARAWRAAAEAWATIRLRTRRRSQWPGPELATGEITHVDRTDRRLLTVTFQVTDPGIPDTRTQRQLHGQARAQ